MAVYEWKKKEKEWYGTGTSPVELTVPEFGFFVVEGQGRPDSELFQTHVELLYTMSYGVRMSSKNGKAPEGFFEYVVWPLEGVWDLVDPSLQVPGFPLDKDNLKWRLMIRQPDFVTADWALGLRDELMAKKKLPLLAQVGFERLAEGRCVQILHEGSFDTEPASFRVMKDFCRKESLARVNKTHREIYLSDPRKTEADKLRTLLRIRVRDDFSCI